MLLSLSTGFLNPLFDDAMHRSGKGVDFFAVHQAGQNVIDGADIYSTDPVRQVVPFYNPYRYHPFVALTIGVLARMLPPFTAYGIWIVLLEMLLIVNIIVTRRLFSNEADADRATVLWLLFTPLYLELYMGQFSFVMATLIFWALVSWIRKRKARGDWFWITSLLVKSNSVLFVPVLIKEKRWKTVITGSCVALALGIPYFVLVPGSYHEFARNYMEAPAAQSLFGNQGLAALIGISLLRLGGQWTDYVQEFVTRLGMMNATLVVPLLVWSAVILATTIVLTVKARSDQAVDLFLLWILSYILFYKHVWEHQYVMLLPVFVLLYWRIKSGGLRMPSALFWSVFAVVALPTLFVVVDRSPVLYDPELSWNFWESFAVHAPKPLATLILYVSLAAAMLKRKPSNPQPSPVL